MHERRHPEPGNVARLDIDDPRWSEFVRSRPEATFFHDPRWARLVADCYGFRPFALAHFDREDQLSAGLPVAEVRSLRGVRRWIALPFSDHCGILGTVPDSTTLVDAADAERLRANVQSLEVRGPLASSAAVRLERTAVRHILDLTDGAPALLRRMSRMHQGSLRKAERLSVRIVESRSEGLEEFYRLHLRTRRRLGVPIQPRRFFQLIKDRVLDEKAGYVLTATIDGIAVAAGVFFTYGQSVVFKYSASDERSWDARPNHLLAWWAIRESCERGFRVFDWGRTDADNEGLRTYKRAFGSEEQALPYTWLGSPPPPASRRPIGRSMGVLIRHSPAWVCQAIGETLYGFA